VLDLGTSDADPLKLKINPGNETGRYVALSHCWGGSTPVMTTNENLDSFTKYIPTPLPQTFADAVLVTRALDIRYLWIDSLCIIQDSVQDWQTQAPLMGRVYSEAYVTIAADAATNSTDGFLNHSNRSLSKEVEVDYPDKIASSPIWVRERGSLGYLLPFHDFPARLPVQEISGSPSLDLERLRTLRHMNRANTAPESKLSTRGWVFQERALSPRTLFFGQAEMGWECDSIIDCECRALGVRYQRPHSLLKTAKSGMSWSFVIEAYSRLDLTVPEDRLAALSGLAEVRSRRGKHRNFTARAWKRLRMKAPETSSYVAGLFEKSMRKQLLWAASFTGPAFNSYIAPTWSWASIRGAITYNIDTSDIGGWRIVSFECPPATNNEFGMSSRVHTSLSTDYYRPSP
jgi:hypothetical protein